DWLTPPPPVALEGAAELLRRLGAIDGTGALTGCGRRMLRFPAHPRLARVLVEAEDRGVAEDAATVVALIAERDIRTRNDAGGDFRSGRRDNGTDLIALLESFENARAARFSRDRLRTLGLDPRATTMVDQARRQFLGAADTRRPARPVPADRRSKDLALARAVLAGFPDRVARRRAVGARTVVLSGGGT